MFLTEGQIDISLFITFADDDCSSCLHINIFISENTARQYETSLRTFARAHNGRRWSEIKQNDITLYLARERQQAQAIIPS